MTTSWQSTQQRVQAIQQVQQRLRDDLLRLAEHPGLLPIQLLRTSMYHATPVHVLLRKQGHMGTQGDPEVISVLALNGTNLCTWNREWDEEYGWVFRQLLCRQLTSVLQNELWLLDLVADTNITVCNIVRHLRVQTSIC